MLERWAAPITFGTTKILQHESQSHAMTQVPYFSLPLLITTPNQIIQAALLHSSVCIAYSGLMQACGQASFRGLQECGMC